MATPKKTTAPKKAPKKKPTPKKPDKHTEMLLRHTFTIKETVEIAKKLAEGSRDLNQAEEEKKAVTSQLKAKVDQIQSRVTELAGKINSGYEYRTTKVTVKYHYPKTGIKTLIRDDTKEKVEEAEMSQGEMQDELPLAEGSPHAPKPIDNPADVRAHGKKVLENPVLTPENAKKVTPATGTVQVEADGGSQDDEK